jgi:hypothetical protein
MTFVLEMARYDMDTDLRDRSRFVTALMGLAPSTETDGDGGAAPAAVDEEALEHLAEHAMGIMLAPKVTTHTHTHTHAHTHARTRTHPSPRITLHHVHQAWHPT